MVNEAQDEGFHQNKNLKARKLKRESLWLIKFCFHVYSRNSNFCKTNDY